MNYNDQMRVKLKSNIYVVTFILLVTLVFTGIKIYQLTSTNILDIQSVMLLKDYFPLLLSGYGILALIVSVLTYFKFDSFYPKQQVILFCMAGMIFMPFTIILFVIGIMKYLEKSKFKAQLFGASLAGMIIFGIIVASVLTPLSNIQPVYLNEHVIEADYVINEDTHFELTVTGVYRGHTLEKIIFDAYISADAPNLEEVGTEFVQISMNRKRTCVMYAFDEAQDHHRLTCEVSNFNATNNQDFTLTDFVNFEDLFIEIGDIDYDRIMNINITGSMRIVSQEINVNVYEKYYPEN